MDHTSGILKRRRIVSLAFLSGMMLFAPVVAAAGGSDGGSQGVIDRFGNFHFADVFKENVAEPYLKATPEKLAELLSAKPCTKHLVQPLSENKRYRRITQNLRERLDVGDLSKIEASLREGVLKVLNNHSFNLTRFPLPQLRDATSAKPETQYQIAYFENGQAYFQEQLLDLLDDSEIEAVMIKEALRDMNLYGNLRVPNSGVEETCRAVLSGNVSRTEESAIAKKVRERKAAHQGLQDEYDRLQQRFDSLDKSYWIAKDRQTKDKIRIESEKVYDQLTEMNKAAFKTSTQDYENILAGFGTAFYTAIGVPMWIGASVPALEIPKSTGPFSSPTWNIRTGKLVSKMFGACRKSVPRDDLSTAQSAIEAGSRIKREIEHDSQRRAMKYPYQDASSAAAAH
ncbi:MAG TPA: hypothetical protein VJB59_09510 [Bdellovibrionota bacterium]|nr:hypothetical protein [Bdellovibrionota bacterium]